MKLSLLLLFTLSLLPGWPAHSQPTSRAPMPSTVPTPSTEVCIEAGQAKVIQAALNRFELLKQAYATKSAAYQSLLAAHVQDSTLLTINGRLLNQYQHSYQQEQALHQDALGKVTVTQRQSTRRGLLVIVEAAAIALLGYSLITK
jgi:hypothetical protein